MKIIEALNLADELRGQRRDRIGEALITIAAAYRQVTFEELSRLDDQATREVLDVSGLPEIEKAQWRKNPRR